MACYQKVTEFNRKNWPSVKVLDFVKYVWNVENSNLEPKNCCSFFANVFWCNISSENYFHKHDIYNLIYMSIHVKRKLRQNNVKSVENISRKKQE